MKILFLCTGNSCRSQMAEGFARHLLAGVVEPFSAGTVPSVLNPNAVKVMNEVGVDIRSQRSKHINELTDVPFDLVVTVCDSAKEACPIFPGKVAVLHHQFDDPPALAAGAASEEEALIPYRRVRDEIRVFIEQLRGRLQEIAGPKE